MISSNDPSSVRRLVTAVKAGRGCDKGRKHPRLESLHHVGHWPVPDGPTREWLPGQSLLGIEGATTVEIQHGVALVRKCQCRDAGEAVGAAAQEGPVYEAQASFPKVGRPRAQAPRSTAHVHAGEAAAAESRGASRGGEAVRLSEEVARCISQIRRGHYLRTLQPAKPGLEALPLRAP
jgi:hypothetical protein